MLQVKINVTNATKNGCIFNLQSNMVAFYRPESDWH